MFPLVVLADAPASRWVLQKRSFLLNLSQPANLRWCAVVRKCHVLKGLLPSRRRCSFHQYGCHFLISFFIILIRAHVAHLPSSFRFRHPSAMSHDRCPSLFGFHKLFSRFLQFPWGIGDINSRRSSLLEICDCI